ncbi:MAG: hypothetical protein KKF77_08145 [Proteobacteria bacterium]|nr:hypothetical protein [Pseudomonadota bacterium]
MLTPFSTTDAKPSAKIKARPRKGQQRSLWSVGAISDRKASARTLKDAPESFASILPMWERKAPRRQPMQVEDINVLKGVAGRLAAAIEARLSAHYRETRKAALQHPSDVAAYLALREVDEKALLEVPGFRLQALDFGVKALLEE